MAELGILPRLTSLRAVAAGVVFAYHLGLHGVWDPVSAVDIGYVGVGFFFVLSGFVLTASMAPETPPRRFYWRRFARIYPSHLVVTLAACFLLTPVSKGVRSFLASVVLIQAWSVDEAVVYGMNGVTWSLACEVAFYAAFPLTVLVLRRRSNPARWMIGLMWYACASAVVWISVSDDRSDAFEVFASVSPVIRFSEFLLGVIAAIAIRDGWRPSFTLWPAGIIVGVLAVIARYLPVPYPLPNQLLAPAFVMVVIAAARTDLVGTGGVLTSRWFVRAGEVSFAFYLVHELVIINLQSWLEFDGPLLAAVALVASAAVAVALHRLVERPCQTFVRATFAPAVSPPAVSGPSAIVRP